MNMKTQKDVHNPFFRESAICPKCQVATVQEPVVKSSETVKKNYSLTESGRTFLIRMVGLVTLVLNGFILELCYQHAWTWSVTAWFVQFAIGAALTICAEMFSNFEPLVKITTSKTPKPSDYVSNPQ